MSDQHIRFAAFEVELEAGEVRKHGIRLKLQEQPFHVLALLLMRPGRIVTREELRLQLWPADTFVDFDHGLNSAINKLREALGDSADNPRFIETLPRRGYRFIGTVDSAADSALAADAGLGKRDQVAARPATPDPSVSSQTAGAIPASRRRNLSVLVAVGTLATLAVLLLGLNVAGIRHRLFGPSAAAQIKSIAVLPLDNLSKDPEQEYFAEGMTAELISKLAQIESLRVISRTSVMRYKGANKPLPQIAQELNVDAVVDGTLVRSGDRIRITAVLLDARTDRHLWAKEYDRDLRDVLALQNDVASAIAQEIRVRLAPQVQDRLASSRQVNIEAYQAYLLGQHYLNKRTVEAIKEGMAYFDQALAKDPEFAPAYAGKSSSYGLLAFYGGLPPKEAYPRRKEAALKALELDPSLADAYVSLGYLQGDIEGNRAAAENSFKQAIKLSPNSAPAHHGYSLLLAASGRFDESLAENLRTRELDPLWPGSFATASWICYYARRFDQGVAPALKSLQLDPNFSPAHWTLGLIYEQQGRYADAIKEFRATLNASGDRSFELAMLGHAYAVAGRTREAEDVLRQLQQPSRKGYVSAFHIAAVYAALRRKDDALTWLNKALQDYDPWIVRLKVDPRFDALRSEKQFRELLARLGHPPE